MLILECPNCGPRNASEFRFGGEYKPRPQDPMAAGEEEWVEYLYLRDNPAGVTRELWFHEQGDRSWLVVTRNTLTHEITKVELARDVALAAGR